MKRIFLLFMAAVTMSIPLVSSASEDAASAKKGSAKAGTEKGIHQSVVEGVKATYRVIPMEEYMKAMRMPMAKNVKETHHIQAEFADARSGKPMTEGEVQVRVVAPDSSDQIQTLTASQGHFGADFAMPKKGKYKIVARSQLPDGKIRSTKFWYTVK